MRHGVFHGNSFSAPNFVSMEVEERDALRAIGVGNEGMLCPNFFSSIGDGYLA